jgi:lipid II:glycine glycyltransferase (peptidoglycan interpeptide bridge formation enzyme)
MIRINGRGATYGEVWFDEEPPRNSGIDIVLYRQRPAPLGYGCSTPFLSLVTDLAADEEAILAGFGKDCRYKIRRAEARDGLSFRFFHEPGEALGEFSGFYDAFARQKGLEPSDAHWLEAACNARQLALSSAARDGEVLAWHAYVVAGATAQLQYTASSFRNRDPEGRALVGRANRWLHWRGMLRFRELGLERYDWGGLFEDESTPERAGINRFKGDFGGRRERSYNCTLPVTLHGVLYMALREGWQRLRSSRAAA